MDNFPPSTTKIPRRRPVGVTYVRALRDRDFTTVFALTHGVGPACLTADTAIAYLLDDAQPEIEPAAPAEQLHWRTGLFHRALESRPVILAA